MNYVHNDENVWTKGVTALVVFLSICACSVRGQEGNLTCKPRPFLDLDKPYPRPRILATFLPYCSQYTCSCCNRTHATLIRRLVEPLERDGFSSKCLAYVKSFLCAACDPEVGVGRTTSACGDTCTSWYTACQGEFFAYHPPTGLLVPCGETHQHELLCSRLNTFVEDGSTLCAAMGLPVAQSQEERCFNGVAQTAQALGDLCEAAPLRSSEYRDEFHTPTAVFVVCAAGLFLLLAWGSRRWHWMVKPEYRPYVNPHRE